MGHIVMCNQCFKLHIQISLVNSLNSNYKSRESSSELSKHTSTNFLIKDLNCELQTRIRIGQTTNQVTMVVTFESTS